VAAFQQQEKYSLVEFPGTMSVGIGQGRAFGSLIDSQMGEFPFASGKALADLPQRVGAAQLAEQHGDKLAPTAKAAGMPLGSRFFDEQLKLGSRKKLENLTKHATESIHVGPPFVGLIG